MCERGGCDIELRGGKKKWQMTEVFSVSTQRLLEVKSGTTRKLEMDEVVQAASKAFFPEWWCFLKK